MAYSYTQISADGSTNTFAVPFLYISKSHVAVKVDGVATTFTWPTTATVTLTDTAASLAGKVVEIRRTTPRDVRLVDFQDAANVTEAMLDTSSLQHFYIAQEFLDDNEGNLTLASDSKYDALSRVIKNLANGVNAQDAVTMTQLTSAILGTLTPTAASLAFTPVGQIVATNVQAAIAEVDAEVPHKSTADTITGSRIFQGTNTYSEATGTDTYVSTLGIAALVVGATYHIKFPNANTVVNPTININGLGAVTIKRMDSAALLVGDLSGHHTLRCGSGEMLLVNPRHAITTVTPAAGDNDTSVASTAFVQGAFAGSVPIVGTHLFGMEAQPQNTTYFIGENGTLTGVQPATVVEADILFWPIVQMRLKDLRAYPSPAPAAGQTVTITVRKNGADTGLSLVITSAGGAFSNTANEVTVGPGDYVSFKSVTSATSGAVSVSCSVRFVDLVSSNGVSCIPFNNLSSTTYYTGAFGLSAAPLDASVEPLTFPVVHANSYIYKYYEQGVTGATISGSLTVGTTLGIYKTIYSFPPVGSTNLFGQVTTDVAVLCLHESPLDSASYYRFGRSTVDGAVTRHRGSWAILQKTAGAPNQIKPLYCTSRNHAQGATKYMGGHACDGNTLETTKSTPLSAGRLKNFIVTNEGTGIAGQLWTVNVRKNGATIVTLLLSGNIVVATDTASEIVWAAGDLFSVQVVSGGTTGQRSIQFACDHVS